MSIAINSKLTSTQKNIVALLELRGAYESSRAAEKAWSTGESFQLDSRNGAARGIVRLITSVTMAFWKFLKFLPNMCPSSA